MKESQFIALSSGTLRVSRELAACYEHREARIGQDHKRPSSNVCRASKRVLVTEKCLSSSVR
ncbi:uncharacterized protein BDV14DRAFT_171504 [Aspergillus stella-maris]|uniref:uncharacterized protein n=1 Tax=Aspergillus stella-maris TaxID=1810926 RepID=UPI003CCDBCE9